MSGTTQLGCSHVEHDLPVFPLLADVHRSFDDELIRAEVQGRLDDVEEEALFRFQDEVEGLRRGEAWRKTGLER